MIGLWSDKKECAKNATSGTLAKKLFDFFNFAQVVVLNFLQNIRHFSGLMGDFSVRLSYGSRRCVKRWPVPYHPILIALKFNWHQFLCFLRGRRGWDFVRSPLARRPSSDRTDLWKGVFFFQIIGLSFTYSLTESSLPYSNEEVRNL